MFFKIQVIFSNTLEPCMEIYTLHINKTLEIKKTTHFMKFSINNPKEKTYTSNFMSDFRENRNL